MERAKMSRELRAKQFMPFAALKGYEEALAAKEHITVEKSELSEESLAELNQVMQKVQKKDIVTVIYYGNEEYVKLTGMVSRMDESARLLQVVNTKISFDDIYSVTIENKTEV